MTIGSTQSTPSATTGRTTSGRTPVQPNFDLVVVGGGAMGCALAWEGASRGLRVALCEKADFGTAASANSLRIVHGGLRYLQKLDFARARYSAGERSALLRIAPNLVKPLKCSVLTIGALTRSRPVFAAGLMANAIVTWDRNRGLAPAQRLPRGGLSPLADYRAAAEGIVTDGATGAATWYDGVLLDPWRLCLAFALSAEHQGAALRNYTAVEGIEVAGDSSCAAVHVRDVLSEQAETLTATAVADCRSLPGSSLFDPASGERAAGDMVVAVNVVFNDTRVAHAVGFPGRDSSGRIIPGRLYFAAPQERGTAVGTWYFDSQSVRADGTLDPVLLRQILGHVNAATVWALTEADIAEVQIGRLPAQPDAGGVEPVPAERPSIGRDPGAGAAPIWQVQTEKWTTVRGVAQAAIETIAADAGFSVEPSQTRTTSLYGNDATNAEALLHDLDRLLPDGCPAPVRSRIAGRYGSKAREIARSIAADPAAAGLVPGTPALSVAEVDYCVRHERPRTLADLAQRRLGLGAVAGDTADVLAARLAAFTGSAS